MLISVGFLNSSLCYFADGGSFELSWLSTVIIARPALKGVDVVFEIKFHLYDTLTVTNCN